MTSRTLSFCLRSSLVDRSARFLSVGVLLLAAIPGARGQSLDWAKRAGGTSIDEGLAIAADAVGNNHVTGYFTGSATFGPGEANQSVLSSSFADVFVARYGSNGALSWVRQASGDNGSRGLGIAVDSGGNSYVTGTFRIFLSFVGGLVDLSDPSGSGDLFVAKYSNAGSLQWAVQAGPNFIAGVPSGGKRGNAIATDVSGNSYVTGAFGTSLGEAALFVAKYNTGGSLVWSRYARNSATLGNEGIGTGISVDANGNSYVAGTFAGSVTFGPGEAREATLTSACSSCRDMFVAKFDPNGAFVWVKRVPGATALGLSVDDVGNSHATGRFTGSSTFGAGETNQTTLVSTSPIVNDLFVAKFDTNGLLTWARKAGGSGDDEGRSISVDGDGNSHVAGSFQLAATFGLSEPKQTVLTAAGNNDVFVANFDSSGSLRWAKSAGGISADAGQGISTDDSGNTYVTGAFAGSATFGGGETNQTVLAAPGTEVVVARYRNDTPPAGGLDLDIQRFTARLQKTHRVALELVVRNASGVNGTVVATVVGVQNGLTIYNRSMAVSDPVGGGATRFDFPAYDPIENLSADILWTVSFQDQNPDVDQAQDTTLLDMPAQGLDLDIQQFTARLRMNQPDRPLTWRVELELVVRNASNANGTVVATVVGIQNGLTIYNRSMVVSDPVGGGATRFDFPAYDPIENLRSNILWTVSFQDQNPDVDQAQDTTLLDIRITPALRGNGD